MKINNYQPVRFTLDSGVCNCNSNTTQPVLESDITQFQVEMEVCNFAEDLVENGDFGDQAGTGWTLNGFAIGTKSVSASTGSFDTLETEFEVMGLDIAYQLEIDITSNQGTPLLIFFGTRKIAEVSTTGKFQLSGVCDASGTDVAGKLRIESGESNSVTIERIALYPLETDIGLLVQSVGADGGLTSKVFRSLKDDIDDANYTFFRVDRNTITVSFDWGYVTDAVNGLGLDYGCYSLGIAGKCQNTNSQLGVFDPEMVMPSNFGSKTDFLTDTSFPWRCDDSVSVKVENNTGIMEYNGFTSPVEVTDINTSTALVGLTYDFVVNVLTMVGGGASLDVNFGGATQSIVATGVHTFSLTAVSTAGLDIDFIGMSSCTIEYFRMDVSNIGASLLLQSSDWDSNVFNLASSHDCTLLIGASNNEDAYGLNFESAFFTPKARVKGSLRAMNFESEVETHINGLDDKIIDYFEQRKSVGLRLQEMPEYLVDWLSLFRGFNKVFVDGTEYVAEKDVDVTWNRFCDTAKVEVELGEIRQTLTNINRKGLSAMADINNYLVRIFDENEDIIFIDGDQIELKG